MKDTNDLYGICALLAVKNDMPAHAEFSVSVPDGAVFVEEEEVEELKGSLNRY